MALKPCPECGREISDQTKTCPLCGAPVKWSDPGKRALYWIAGFVLLVIAIQHSADERAAREASRVTSAPPARPDESIVRAMACEAAISAVKTRLKAPATADFPNCSWNANEYQVKSDGGSVYMVAGHVDAQNSFGAKLRQQFIVELSKGPGTSISSFRPAKVAIE